MRTTRGRSRSGNTSMGSVVARYPPYRSTARLSTTTSMRWRRARRMTALSMVALPLVVVVMVVMAVFLAAAAGGLGLQHPVERGGRVARDVEADAKAAVVGQHDVLAVLVDDVDGPP